MRTSPAPAASAADPAAREPESQARALRADAMAQVRRSLIMDAARAAFFELGLDGVSMREIARRAGYTPGAIYSYFASKEEIYAALLGESLERLNEHVAAGADAGSPNARLRSKAGAFFEFYRENPRDLDLGFYLFKGVRPMGLTRELNAQLDARLRAALQPSEEALIAHGLDAAAAEAEVTALFAHMVGLLVLIHTGRIRMFGQQAQRLLERYFDHLVDRLPASARAD